MPTTMNLIAKQTIGAGGAASVTFSSIPQTFTDLKIVVSARSSASSKNTDCSVRIGNGSVSTSSIYSYRELTGNGSSAFSGSGTSDKFNTIINAATSTSSTFSNFEVYLPNYTSSNNKSLSVDAVIESNENDAAIQVRLQAWLWANTSAINIIQLFPGSGSFVEFSEITLYGISSSSTQNQTTPSAIGGDVITTDGTYWYHAFKYSGSFTPLKNMSADVLVIAGGGAGGSKYRGGGGGAGGLAYYAAQSLTASSNYSCTIGAGGAGHTGDVRNQGGSSTFLGLTAANGGGGGGDYGITTAGQSGGSGGGGGNQSSDEGAGGSATPAGQGNAGSAAVAPNGGGGGGATVAGGTSTSSNSGAGGNGSSAYSSWGLSTVTGQNVSGTVWYAGGGSGAPYTPAGATAGAAGLGGGGIGTGSGSGTNGTVNTGGGGGGSNFSGTSGSGGSGIIIVRYAV
jgi:hypothetical protein